MDDAVHIEVQVVELFAIRIRSSCIDGNFLAINLPRLLFDDRTYDFGLTVLALQMLEVKIVSTYIFLAQPAKQS